MIRYIKNTALTGHQTGTAFSSALCVIPHTNTSGIDQNIIYLFLQSLLNPVANVKVGSKNVKKITILGKTYNTDNQALI